MYKSTKFITLCRNVACLVMKKAAVMIINALKRMKQRQSSNITITLSTFLK